MRTRVKVCGITRLEDATLACDLGADALGFIFAPESPRCIQISAAREIIRTLPPFVTPVAVVVNPKAEDLARLVAESGTRVIQFHGEEEPAFCRQMGSSWYKAFRVGAGFRPEDVDLYDAPWCLLDGHVDGTRGGTGQTFDWSIAEAVRQQRRFILAGGIGPENIAEAVSRAAPDAIDLNSGVESEPGVKDAERLRAAFAALEEVQDR
ncbi:MAG: phosphoribosylanthranilate isomerase [Acidobacteria bacterium]|nr:phosphoribosylanthranilate isomerase [Acidobacteriota bacterium]